MLCYYDAEIIHLLFINNYTTPQITPRGFSKNHTIDQSNCSTDHISMMVIRVFTNHHASPMMWMLCLKMAAYVDKRL